LRAWANFSDCGFSRRVFLFRQEFSFSQSYRFFPSFCQALAEDRVTTPTKKKNSQQAHCDSHPNRHTLSSTATPSLLQLTNPFPTHPKLKPRCQIMQLSTLGLPGLMHPARPYNPARSYAPCQALCTLPGLMHPARPYAPCQALSTLPGLMHPARPYAPCQALCTLPGLMHPARSYAPCQALCTLPGLKHLLDTSRTTTTTRHIAKKSYAPHVCGAMPMPDKRQCQTKRTHLTSVVHCQVTLLGTLNMVCFRQLLLLQLLGVRLRLGMGCGGSGAS